jgi:hypothetical protein
MDNKRSEELGNLQIVVCECGEKILVIPDLKEMSQCITKHALIHAEKETDCIKAKAEFCRIEEQLTQKVILKVSNIKLRR